MPLLIPKVYMHVWTVSLSFQQVFPQTLRTMEHIFKMVASWHVSHLHALYDNKSPLTFGGLQEEPLSVICAAESSSCLGVSGVARNNLLLLRVRSSVLIHLQWYGGYPAKQPVHLVWLFNDVISYSVEKCNIKFFQDFWKVWVQHRDIWSWWTVLDYEVVHLLLSVYVTAKENLWKRKPMVLEHWQIHVRWTIQ